MSECCKQGFLAHGVPQGNVQNIEGRSVYVTEPTQKKKENEGKAILYLHDGYGYELINNRLLADSYANEVGVTVYVPDFFEGTGMPVELLNDAEKRTKYDFRPFMAANNREVRWPTILNFAKALKEQHSISSLASIGFCWGGWGSVMLGGTDLVKGFAVAHPSLLKLPEDIQNVSKPSLFICAEIDPLFPAAARQQTEEILKNKSLDASFKFYPGTQHGFAVRGDSEDKIVATAALDAKNQAVEFFNRVL